MMLIRRRLACCTRDREISFDFDEQERIMTYNGLGSCILNNQTYENESSTSKGEECVTDSIEDYDSSCSSSKDVSGSFSSQWLKVKRDEQGSDEWELSENPKHFYVKEKPTYSIQVSDVEAMKDKFAKLLLGEDITGGKRGLSTALALSNAITNLAATVFGELWKLEPLADERKSKWKKEMGWFLSPAHYMVELVPAKQTGPNGGTLEIMTPKVRSDINVNLPALQKLDTMLLETLDSMVNTEFWYAEGGSRAEGRSNKDEWKTRRWWLPSPRVPTSGLSDTERKTLLYHGRVVCQVFKAAKSINESVLSEIPVSGLVREAICKSGKASINDELHKILTIESSTPDEMLNSLNLNSEHSALEAINRLEATIFAWKEKIVEQVGEKSPVRTSWSSFIWDSISEMDKTELLLDRAIALHQQLRIRYPNLPQSFLDAKKIQYCKDVGHSILEAYSRVLSNLAFSILSRIRDILQEDAHSNPNSRVELTCYSGISLLNAPNTPSSSCSIELSPPSEARSSSVTETPSRGRPWCIGREACISTSPANSP